jgi:hypothetical protein
LGINGEYNFYPCGLGAYFLEVHGPGCAAVQGIRRYRRQRQRVDAWIRQNTKVKEKLAIIRWNNEMIGLAIV